ncbi:MAG TPA: hypothetical protein VME45_04030 [Stellaceae bacterium]|nr:hypothetical protein [Stellaceae bacterium]
MRRRTQFTRRKLLAAGLGLIAVPAHATEQPPANSNKISQAAADYQSIPKGMFSCAVCTFFIKPKSCKVVDGEVSPTGWCKLFDMVD